MFPIFEQGKGHGIGQSFNKFLNRFIEICNEHLISKKAKSFAFILYDFNDHQIKQILKSQGGFVLLDRIAGDRLSIFYLHSNDKILIKAFNKIFLGAFELNQHNVTLPFVLFFKVDDDEVINVKVVELEQTNLMFAFNELYELIEEHINENTNIEIESKSSFRSVFLKIIKPIKKFPLDKFLEWILDKGFEASKPYL